MKGSRKLWWLMAVPVVMTACASGPRYAQMRDTIPALDPEQGRIFIYRITALGAAIQPNVKLNGVKVGDAVPGGFFYVDRPPGEYQINTTTEVKRTLSLLLEKAQTRYVRLNVSLGFFAGHVYAELVEPNTGAREIQQCSYTGAKTGR